MPSTLEKPQLTRPDDPLVSVRLTPAKANLRDKTGADVLSDVVMAAVRRAYGKQGAAAHELGKDEGNFSRDVKAGRFATREMAALGPQFLAELGRELVEQFGALSTPKDYARRAVRDIRRDLEALEQYIEVA